MIASRITPLGARERQSGIWRQKHRETGKRNDERQHDEAHGLRAQERFVRFGRVG
jgi:hypothetical protein